MKLKSVTLKCLISPLITCALTHASSDPIQIDKDQFSEFLRTGTESKTKLDIEKDNLFWISERAWNLKDNKLQNIQSYQPARTQGGMLFIIDYTRTVNPKTNKIETTKGVSNIVNKTITNFFDTALNKNEIMDYPKFPIVYRINEAEKLGLNHLTITFCDIVPDIIEYGSVLDILTNTAKMRKAIKSLIEIPIHVIDDYAKLIKTIKADEVDQNPRNFKQDKERLFTTMFKLHKALGQELNREFLNEVFKIDSQLTDIFRQIYDNSKESNAIKFILSQAKNIKARNIMAKALIMDVLNHIDENPVSTVEKMANLKTVYVCKNYGQMARFINHTSDNEHKHLYRADENIPLVADKSYFVLAKNETYESFYDKLYDAILKADVTYDIHDVKVTKDDNPDKSDTVVVEIKLNEDILQTLVNNMLYSNNSGYKSATKLIRLVIRETIGTFDLITAYPIQETKATTPGQETKEEIYAAYNTHFFPQSVKRTISRNATTYILNHK